MLSKWTKQGGDRGKVHSGTKAVEGATGVGNNPKQGIARHFLLGIAMPNRRKCLRYGCVFVIMGVVFIGANEGVIAIVIAPDEAENTAWATIIPLPADGSLFGGQSCSVVLMTAFRRAWDFLTGDEGQIFFAVAAATRAMIFYLKKSDMKEAKHLGDVLLTAALFAMLLAASEAQLSQAMKEAYRCKKAPFTIIVTQLNKKT